MAISTRLLNGFHITAETHTAPGHRDQYEATLTIAAMAAGARKGAIRRFRVPTPTEYFASENSAIQAAQSLANRLVKIEP